MPELGGEEAALVGTDQAAQRGDEPVVLVSCGFVAIGSRSRRDAVTAARDIDRARAAAE